MQQLTIIKIGGNIIDDEKQLSSFLDDFASIKGHHKILVHGGGKVATEIGKRLNIEPHYVDGRRVTDEATLEVVTMVYGGLLNKRIVAALQSLGCDAIGLTGVDADIIPAVKRPVKDVDYGYVGDVTSDKVNGKIFKTFLEAGLTPVLAPLTHDGHGVMLNTNADTIAQEVAKCLAAITTVQLIYCFEKKGVLADADDDNSVIDSISRSDFDMLKADGIISGGMLPKLENAFAAIEAGVMRVSIGHAAELKEIINGNAGTSIQ